MMAILQMHRTGVHFTKLSDALFQPCMNNVFEVENNIHGNSCFRILSNCQTSRYIRFTNNSYSTFVLNRSR